MLTLPLVLLLCSCGLMTKTLLAALLMLPLTAFADIVTEFGAGYKLPRSTSVLLLPECHLATIIQTQPSTPRLDFRNASCGGDNPAFIGWPVAWQSSFSDIWTVRTGWFHLSQWFDGGKDREIHMDAIAVTTTFNWSEWKRQRGQARK